ncbi:histidine kinase [Natronococcus pandeyae]|uniref:histidine kinase n=1 Tax=Natronococcus pandeyae TaxID=2055836 RepID=A0A8J8TTF8_9EURY|nr:ATP-binding protein [Natronococcus pandeyae]TYL39834.1 histidine kinase [Natronococcus pandeyae]
MTGESGSPIPPDDATRVYDRITDAVFALDEEWRFTFLNEQAERVLRRDEEELLGTALWNAFPDAVGSTFQQEYERAMETQEPVTFEEYLESLDAWFEVRAYPSETGLTVYFRETTDRVRREDQIQTREQALQDAYEVLADPDQPLVDQISSLLEVVRETVGTEYATLSRVHPDTNEYTFEAVDAPDDADLEEGETVPLETTNCERVVDIERTLAISDVESDAPELADRTGNVEWGISCYLGTPVFVDGEVYGTFCFYDRDARAEGFSDWEVTFVELLSNWVGYKLEREQYQRELEASNEELEQFASAVSHDLQEPLRMVSSYLSLIQERYGDELDGEVEEFLEFAVDGADRMREMIDGLLAYSRIETQGNPFEPVDLNAVLDDVIDDLQFKLEETDAELSVGSLPRVEGDDDQLRQVFQNLLSNAITYSGDDPPRVDVTAERESAAFSASDSRDPTVSRDDSRWVISVSDDGIGIDPDDRKRIFDVFERLHSREEYEGTGIGLALCQRIVERHGGEIWIDPNADEGTTVQFTLPDASTHES